VAVEKLTHRRHAHARPLEHAASLDRQIIQSHLQLRNGRADFGLFGPRAVGKISAAVLVILKQEPRPRPKPRRWAESIKRDYGRDPLLDDTGQRMRGRDGLPRTLQPSQRLTEGSIGSFQEYPGCCCR
jgi:hypothetical protein